MRQGITPVVAVVLLLMMTVAVAGGAYTWFSQVQEEARTEADETLAASLSVKDVRCDVSNITATVRNSGDTVLTGDTVDVYVYQDDRLVDTASSPIGPGLTEPGTLGTVTALLNASLDPRTATRVELVVPADDVSTSVSCTSEPSTISGEWRYRRPVNITAPSGTTLTDHQVNWTLDTATLIADGKMNASCTDIRLWDPVDGTIPHWYENCDATDTSVWTKVPRVAAGSTRTIYLYYGNTDAPDERAGDAVFVQFDDFEDGDMAEWVTAGASVETVTSPVKEGDRAGRVYGGDGAEDAQIDDRFYLDRGRIIVWSRVATTDTMRQEFNAEDFSNNQFNSFTYEANGEFGTHHTARGVNYSTGTWHKWHVRFGFPGCTMNVSVADATGTRVFNWNGGLNYCYDQTSLGSRAGDHRIDDEIFHDNYRLAKLPVPAVTLGGERPLSTHD